MSNLTVQFSNKSTTIRATVDEDGISRTYLFNSTSALLNWASEHNLDICISDISVS